MLYHRYFAMNEVQYFFSVLHTSRRALVNHDKINDLGE